MYTSSFTRLCFTAKRFSPIYSSMHICVSNLTIIGSDNSLSPGRRQAIIWTNAAILFIGSLGTNFSEILIAILTFSFKKMRLKVSSGKWRPFCLGLNVLIQIHKPWGITWLKLTMSKMRVDVVEKLTIPILYVSWHNNFPTKHMRPLHICPRPLQQQNSHDRDKSR